MSWIGVITDVGQQKINGAIGGTILTINSIKLGKGSVPQANMRSATDLNDYVTTGSLTSDLVQEGLKLRILATAYTSVYTLTEVGVYGRLSGESTDTLIALYQETGDGIAIPDSSTFPDFAYVLYALIASSNVSNITVTVDSSALVSHGELEDSLSDYVEIDQGVANAGKVMKVGNDGLLTPGSVGTQISITLDKDDWSGDTPTQTVTATGVTDSNNIIVGIGSVTQEQLEAISSAQLLCTAQGADSVTFTAFGGTPDIDLPVVIMIL